MSLPLPLGGVQEQDVRFALERISQSWRVGAQTTINVREDYGARGDFVADDTAAIQAAITDAANNPTLGATVFFPAGHYKITATLTIPAGANVNLLGTGPSSRLHWSSSVGAATFGIDVTEQNSTFIQRTIQGLRLSGPDHSYANADMLALRWSTRTRVIDCIIDNWNTGLYVWGNHQTAAWTRVRDCVYGTLFPNSTPSQGDQLYVGSALTSCTYASVAIQSGYAISATFIDTHLGFSPYGIYAAASGGGTAACNVLYMYGCTFEAWGDAVIRTNDRAIRNLVMRDTNTLRTNTDQFGGEPNTSVIDAGSGDIVNCLLDRFKVDASGISLPPDGFITAGTISDCEFRAMNQVMDSVSSSFPFCTASGTTPHNLITWGDSEATIVESDVTLSAGQLLGLHAVTGGNVDNIHVHKYNAGEAVYGFAYHDAVTADKLVAVRRGQTTAPYTGGAPAAYNLLKPSATAGSVVIATDYTDVPVVGYARAVGSGGNVALEIQI